jgi:DnaA family protein
MVAARMPPAALGLGLPDLTSRLCAGAAYRLDALDDAGSARLLACAAAERGLTLDQAVVSYILTRCHRAPSRLLRLLDALDRYSLERGRAPTVRLVGELLAERGIDG